MADIVAADSISQCQTRGEIFQALKAGMIKKENLGELGKDNLDIFFKLPIYKSLLLNYPEQVWA